MTIDSNRQRARMLATYATRAIVAARKQRERLAREDPPILFFDLDFYAHAMWSIRETAWMAKKKLGLASLTMALDEFDAVNPHLKSYRDLFTHSIDDRLPGLYEFSSFAAIKGNDGELIPVIHARGKHHPHVENLYEAVLDALEEFTDDALGRVSAQGDEIGPRW